MVVALRSLRWLVVQRAPVEIVRAHGINASKPRWLGFEYVLEQEDVWLGLVDFVMLPSQTLHDVSRGQLRGKLASKKANIPVLFPMHATPPPTTASGFP